MPRDKINSFELILRWILVCYFSTRDFQAHHPLHLSVEIQEFVIVKRIPYGWIWLCLIIRSSVSDHFSRLRRLSHHISATIAHTRIQYSQDRLIIHWWSPTMKSKWHKTSAPLCISSMRTLTLARVRPTLRFQMYNRWLISFLRQGIWVWSCIMFYTWTSDGRLSFDGENLTKTKCLGE